METTTHSIFGSRVLSSWWSLTITRGFSLPTKSRRSIIRILFCERQMRVTTDRQSEQLTKSLSRSVVYNSKDHGKKTFFIRRQTGALENQYFTKRGTNSNILCLLQCSSFFEGRPDLSVFAHSYESHRFQAQLLVKPNTYWTRCGVNGMSRR